MTLRDAVDKHLARFSTAPFLFVGSGLSRRYLGLENWEGLLKKYAALTDRPYDYYRATAGGDLPRVASELASAFHAVWWKDPQFEQSRSDGAEHCQNQDSALKIEISRYLQAASSSVIDGVDVAAEISALRNSVVDGAITTNWDLFLESLFPEFKVFVGQGELLFSEPQAVGEIYKIHGCCSKPNSLVLTRRDYDEFDSRNPYLAAKLLAIFVEHPVIFLGYSLSDKNVISILKSIASCLTTENIAQLQDRLLFVQWDKDVDGYEMTATSIVAEGHVIPVIALRTDSFLPIFEALASVERRFPARLLRQLKERVYDLVLNHDPKARLFVQEIDADADLSNLEVVFGVGALSPLQEIGYKGISREDLIDDVLGEGSNLDAHRIVSDTLPTLLRGARYVPVFKYLREAGLIVAGRIDSDADIGDAVAKAAKVSRVRFYPPQHYRERQHAIVESGATLAELEELHGARYVLMHGALVSDERLAINELQDFLLRNRAFLDEGNSVERTEYIKLVCLLDFLKYAA